MCIRDSASCAFAIAALLGFCNIIPCCFSFNSIMTCFTSVSYTHLDVYKRQIYCPHSSADCKYYDQQKRNLLFSDIYPWIYSQKSKYTYFFYTCLLYTSYTLQWNKLTISFLKIKSRNSFFSTVPAFLCICHVRIVKICRYVNDSLSVSA